MHDLLSPTQPERPRPGRTVRLPAELLDQVKQVADRYGTSKTEALIALINEGLAAAKRRS